MFCRNSDFCKVQILVTYFGNVGRINTLLNTHSFQTKDARKETSSLYCLRNQSVCDVSVTPLLLPRVVTLYYPLILQTHLVPG